MSAVQFFSRQLLEWHTPENRDLPWKKTQDPYKIWLSEIILQQTRVEQGKPYYLKFISLYPTVEALALAPLDHVLKTWEGLGYYSRARNLHQAGQSIVQEYGGVFPNRYEDILKLKGIGQYTAAAIASFAFHLPYAVLDGNVYRVLSRYWGIDTPIDTGQGQKYFQQLAQQLLDTANPSQYNQAMMDLGATVCKPVAPLCQECPFASECVAYNKGLIAQLPVKTKRIVKSVRYFHFFVVHDGTHIWLDQRNAKDIWKELFQFPLLETEKSKRCTQKEIEGFLSIGICAPQNQSIYRQTLTHQQIEAVFYEIQLPTLPAHSRYRKISKADLTAYAFPKIIRSYLEDRIKCVF